MFSFFLLEREMEWNDPYHDGGRVVGISLERESQYQSERV